MGGDGERNSFPGHLTNKEGSGAPSTASPRNPLDKTLVTAESAEIWRWKGQNSGSSISHGEDL